MATLGLDISLNSPGIAVLDGDTLHLFFFTQRRRENGFTYDSALEEVAAGPRVKIEAIPFDKEWSKEQKIESIRTGLEAVIGRFKIASANIEDYAYSASTSCITQLAEIGGVVRNILFRNGIPFKTVAIGTLKKSFAGNGHASKEEMYVSFIKKGYPNLLVIIGVHKPTDKPVEDLVDATALATFG